MKALKKMVLVVVILVAIVFIFAQLGIIKMGSKGLEQIDKKFGINNSNMYVEKEKLEKYESEVSETIVFTESEQKEKNLKKKLIKFQNYFQNYLENRIKVDFEEPNCGPESNAQKMKKNFEGALKTALEVKADLSNMESKSIGNTTKQNLQEFFENIVAVLEKSKNAVQKIC